jgi:hypothetical protein
MRSETSAPKPVFWWLGLAVGVVVSFIVTLIIVIWEWLENPGGIFRSEIGTNWNFVFDTATSWFVPTFIYVALIASALHLAWWIVRRHLRRK